MDSSASRGAILIVVAAVIGAIVLGKGFDDDGPVVVSAAGDEPAAEEPADDAPAVGDIDTDGDGEPDTPGIDTTGDGEPDSPAVDTDGDGVVDTPGTDADGDGTVDEPAGGDLPLTPQARAPSEVRVLVANGARVNGAAGLASNRLNAQNYATLDAVNANELLPATIIYYEADYVADAQLIAQALGASPDQLAEMPATDPHGVDRRGANVLVVLGQDDVTEAPSDEG